MTTLTTERLILRPFTLDDAPAVQTLAGAREVALNTLNIPHPYPDGAAEQWIAHNSNQREGRFAVTVRDSGALAGAMGLIVNRDHARAEIGYWIGVPYWNHGYATEAGRAVIRHAFEDLGLNRVFAEVFARNPASARVLQKLGLRHEGSRRQHVVKWGEPVDVDAYAILRGEWNAVQS